MTSSNLPSSPREFTLFLHLPPELRIQIYRHACHPRITVLDYDPITNSFHCPTPPPALLQVSREARAEGLRLYRRCPLDLLPHELPADDSFPDDQFAIIGGLREQRYFYHHPDFDTLYVPRPRPRRHRHQPYEEDGFGLHASSRIYKLGYAPWVFEFERRLPWVKGDAVRRMAVDHVPASVRQPWEVYGKVCMMRSFGQLEEAYMVIGTVSDGSEGCNYDDDDSHRRSGEGGGASAEGREIEFVDPRADDAKIMGIMERVRESFRVELGEDLGLVDRARQQRERPGVGTKEIGLELVPKVVSDVGCRLALCAYSGLGGGGRAVC
ncbi:hypothetical protein VTJ49DRAFT_5127 [Mycothermus thermophilus]|uniref:2EXR domain-containing protein n=1 Tax=Humicola insolens TaxID=85995 RepID=A0ABR3V3X2_HUMIN